MNQRAYDAFYEAVESADDDPVRFTFTKQEVEQFDVPEGEINGFSDEITHNLSTNGYGHLRAACIFQVFAERLK